MELIFDQFETYLQIWPKVVHITHQESFWVGPNIASVFLVMAMCKTRLVVMVYMHFMNYVICWTFTVWICSANSKLKILTTWICKCWMPPCVLYASVCVVCACVFYWKQARFFPFSPSPFFKVPRVSGFFSKYRVNARLVNPLPAVCEGYRHRLMLPLFTATAGQYLRQKIVLLHSTTLLYSLILSVV